jgi:chaperonin cofactor prefoldin
MTKLVEFQVGEGKTILIEVDEVESDEIRPVSKSPGDIAAKARKTFAEALETIKLMVRDIKQQFDDLPNSADELEVKFSIKLSAEVGAVVTKVSGEANYEITLRWKNNQN